MKSLGLIAVLAAALMAVPAVYAQQASAPAGSTGQCKDGTYSSQASKRGACKGHQGVKEWYTASSAAAPAAAASAATPAKATRASKKAAAAAAAAQTPATSPAVAPAAAAAAAPAAAAAATSTKKSTSAPSATAAPGGGPGKVWVNSSSKVYHCPGDRYYGKTKSGQYMTEAAAQAAGDRASGGKSCSP